MPRPSKYEGDMAERIKAVARAQMREMGTSGLSLRAIARELDVTAPAIYNYFARLDDLITALIIDAYNALADAIEQAGAAIATDACGPRIYAMLLAYRRWALDHPAEFQLIYGNPIPGYVAPSEVTTPLARRPFIPIGILFGQAFERGEAHLPAKYAAIPPTIEAHIAGWTREAGFPLSPTLLYVLFAGWVLIHGLIILEVLHHTQPPVGDTEAFYIFEVRAFLTEFGFDLSP